MGWEPVLKAGGGRNLHECFVDGDHGTKKNCLEKDVFLNLPYSTLRSCPYP